MCSRQRTHCPGMGYASSFSVFVVVTDCRGCEKKLAYVRSHGEGYVQVTIFFTLRETNNMGPPYEATVYFLPLDIVL